MCKRKVIVHGALIDGNGGGPIQDSYVVIEDDKIKEAGCFATLVMPEDAEVIDAGGKYIIPGLMVICDGEVVYKKW